MPQLGSEPVRGTGCGADGSIGDIIPDGTSAIFVDPPRAGEPLPVDLLCIFTPEAAADVLADGTATILVPNGATEADVNYLVVNNNEHERIVPAAAGIELRDTAFNGGACVEGPFVPEVDHSGYQAWINIEAGQATWIVWGCDLYGGGSAIPTGGPADHEQTLLANDCALLQDTIWEGDQFIGVEYPADGQPFTESLRQAIQVTRDFFSSEASQVQSQLAQAALPSTTPSGIRCCRRGSTPRRTSVRSPRPGCSLSLRCRTPAAGQGDRQHRRTGTPLASSRPLCVNTQRSPRHSTRPSRSSPSSVNLARQRHPETPRDRRVR